jgi:pimeloyl-ACP methyl ester carboxylesterase
MSQATSGVLGVDGAELHYEVQGEGPLLLMISGGLGDALYYAASAPLLARDYTVLTYDRRGNSRSPQQRDGVMRVEEQSADAVALVEAHGGGPALVFGNSGGAVIALDMAAHHSQHVAGVVAHEPPIAAVLPEADELTAFFDELQATIDAGGDYMSAYYAFMERNGRPVPAQEAGFMEAAAAGKLDGSDPVVRMLANIRFFVTAEMRAFVVYGPDLDGIRASGVPVVMVGGHETRAQFYCRAGEVVAERLGVDFVEIPGHHTSFAEDPVPFVEHLRPLLDRLRGERA